MRAVHRARGETGGQAWREQGGIRKQSKLRPEPKVREGTGLLRGEFGFAQ